MNFVWLVGLSVLQVICISETIASKLDGSRSIIGQRDARRRDKRQLSEQLEYSSSPKSPKQIAIFNSSAQVGIVIDSIGEKVAILNGITGQGVIIDKPLRMGVVVEQGNWINSELDLKQYMQELNVAELMELNSMNTFQIADQNRTCDACKLIESNLVYFGDDFLIRIQEAGDAFFLTMVLDQFSYVINPIRSILGPVLNTASEGWVSIQEGMLAITNVFYWMGNFVSYVSGVVYTLVNGKVRFSLTGILTANNGAQALYDMLNELSAQFDLMNILNGVLLYPHEIARFIAGLGGEVSNGVTGVYNLIANMFAFDGSGGIYAISGFTTILLRYYGSTRPDYQEVQNSAKILLTIAEDQEKRYGNDFEAYREFLQSIDGSGSYSIAGCGVGEMVKLLTDTEETSENQLVGILKVLKLLVPVDQSTPYLLLGMIKLLNTTNGALYLKNIIPTLDIPEDTLEDINSNQLGEALKSSYMDQSLDALKTLTASELIMKLPIVSSIYRELDKAINEQENITLDSLLQKHPVAEELMETTTQALETPIE